MKHGIRRSLSILAMLLVLTATLAACGSDSESSEPTVTRESVAGAPPTRTATVPAGETPEAAADAGTPAQADGGQATGAPTTIEIDMVDLAFEPAELRIPANTDVTINAVNKGALPHTFTLADVADTGEVAGGSSAQVVVNLPAGEYDFHCAVPGHAEAGMVGKLIVEEGGGAAAPASDTSAEATGEEQGAGAASDAVEVDMVDLAFQPTEFTIPADTDVTINLVNSGALPHTFDVETIESGEIPGGGTGSVVVNLPAGTYEYWCAIPGHKEAGMVGTLTVVAGGESTNGAAVATSPETAETPAASDGESTGAAALPTTYEVDMVDLAFNPTELTIPADTDVTINLVNSGALPHTFDVETIESGEIPGGGTGSVVVNLPAGTYEYWCAIPGHKEAGMVGTLTVVGAGSEASPEASPVGSPVASPIAVEPINLEMVELSFKPDKIEIPANTDVTVNLSNSGNLPHNFEITDQDISVDLAAGEHTSFVLNLPVGTYDFICNVPGHAEAGMVGVLTVVEASGATPESSTEQSAESVAAPTGPIEVDMVDLAFDPTEITIPANTDVTIHAVNKGALPHTFTIPDVADTGEVASGASADVTINLPPGEYVYDCAIPGHKEAGMVGKLIVK